MRLLSDSSQTAMTSGASSLNLAMLDLGDYGDIYNLSGAMWNNVSCDLWEVSNHYVKNILEPVICCSGVAGILLTMVVLSQKTICTSTNCYLTALAVADLCFLLILGLRIYVDSIQNCHFILSNEAALFSLYTMIFMEVFHNLAVGITVALAVERYLAICHPMKAMKFCTVGRARLIIVVMAVISFILRCPKFTELEILYIAVANSSQPEMVVTNAFLYNEELYTYIVTGVLLTFLPLVSLTVLNARLIVEIRRSYQYLNHNLGSDWRLRNVVSREEMKMTMMLVSVVIAFFLCHTPYMIFTFMVAVNKFDTVHNSELASDSDWQLFRHLCNILLAIKSSCNFILYCWFSEKFWVTFKRLFCLNQCLLTSTTRTPLRKYDQVHQVKQSHSYLFIRETTC